MFVLQFEGDPAEDSTLICVTETLVMAQEKALADEYQWDKTAALDWSTPDPGTENSTVYMVAEPTSSIGRYVIHELPVIR